MELLIKNIDKRLYNDFQNWAKSNNMDEDAMEKYIIKAFKERFMLDKFGDLNDKIEQPKPKKKREKREVKVEDITPIMEPTNEVNISINEIEQTEVLVEENLVTISEKPKRKKIIKSK